jgi:hypothetical protein
LKRREEPVKVKGGSLIPEKETKREVRRYRGAEEQKDGEDDEDDDTTRKRKKQLARRT